MSPANKRMADLVKLALRAQRRQCGAIVTDAHIEQATERVVTLLATMDADAEAEAA